jgi:hypothetical protein
LAASAFNSKAGSSLMQEWSKYIQAYIRLILILAALIGLSAGITLGIYSEKRTKRPRFID